MNPDNRHGKVYNDQCCLEIFYRAMVNHDHGSWELVQQRFSPMVMAWIRNHPHRDIACRIESEENYVAQTFMRVWQASMSNILMFDTLAAYLSYLKLSLQGAIIDTLRLYSRSKESPLPDPGSNTWYADEPTSEDEYESHELWNSIKSLLTNERERRLAYLLYYCGLKAREIVRYCPDEFEDIQEVYRLTRNIVERLTRHRDQIRWQLSDDEF